MSAPWLDDGWVAWTAGKVEQVWSEDRSEFTVDCDYPDGSHALTVGRDIHASAPTCGRLDLRAPAGEATCGLPPGHESPHVSLLTSYVERGWRIVTVQIRQPARASS